VINFTWMDPEELLMDLDTPDACAKLLFSVATSMVGSSEDSRLDAAHIIEFARRAQAAL
jgi:hypothetical protein